MGRTGLAAINTASTANTVARSSTRADSTEVSRNTGGNIMKWTAATTGTTVMAAALTVGALVLSGCSSDPAMPDTTNAPTTEASEVPETVLSQEPVAETSPSEAEAVEVVPSEEPALVSKAFYAPELANKRYPADGVSFESKDGLTDGWVAFREPTVVSDGLGSPAYSYSVEFPDSTRALVAEKARSLKGAEYPVACLVSGNGSSGCSLVTDFNQASLNNGAGNYTVVVKPDFNSSKEIKVGTLKVKIPNASPEAPLCTVTGGKATRDGDRYTVTIDHKGACDTDSTHLTSLNAVFDFKQKGSDFVSQRYVNASDATEVSHTNDQTVVEFTADTASYGDEAKAMKPKKVALSIHANDDTHAGFIAEIPIKK